MQAWRPWTPPPQGFRRGPCHPRARPSSLAIVGGGLAPRCPGQAPEALSYNTTQSPEPHSVMIYHTMKYASLCCVIRAPVFWGEFASGVSIQACPRKRPKRHPRPAPAGSQKDPASRSQTRPKRNLRRHEKDSKEKPTSQIAVAEGKNHKARTGADRHGQAQTVPGPVVVYRSRPGPLRPARY